MEYLKQMGVNLKVRTIRRKLIFRQASRKKRACMPDFGKSLKFQ
jgi:hypothetical protein